jgi:hypothetical protein
MPETAVEILNDIQSYRVLQDFPLRMFRASCAPRCEIADDEKRIPKESCTNLQADACAKGRFLPPDNPTAQQEPQCSSGMKIVAELVHFLLDLIRTGSNAPDEQSEQLMQIGVQQLHEFLISRADDIAAEISGSH